MNSRAITLIATIAVIGMVAVGAGYALTALSVNDGNNASAKYIVLSQDNYTFSNGTVEYFDTITAYVDTATVTGYNINDGAANRIAPSGYELIKLGTVTLSGTTNGYVTAPAANLVINSTSATSGLDTVGNITYYLVSVGGTEQDPTYTPEAVYKSNGWKEVSDGSTAFSLPLTPDGVNYSPVKLALCYGYATSVLNNVKSVGDYITDDAPENLSGGVIVFEVPVANS